MSANLELSMRTNLYVGLSAQVALGKRVDTIANNIANMNTGGYRADGVKFETALSNAAEVPTSFVTKGSDYISRVQGSVSRTDNPLDVAIQGEGWLAFKSPGGVAYTRDGRMRMSPDGELQTLSGYPVLDAGGAAMLLRADAGAPSIAADGMVTQGGRQVGALGLYEIPADAQLTRYGNSGVIPDKAPIPILDFTTNAIEQGFSEGSNINPVLEITKLISITRAYDSVKTGITTSETSLDDAIKTLGSK
jgi:flagellar basal-body rod protein FlgF